MTKRTEKKEKLLISGGDGLLGKRLIDIVSKNYEVYAITRKKPVNPLPDVEYLNVDLSNISSISNLPQEIDIIIHLAQSSNFRNFPNEANDIFNVNLYSTFFLLDYAYKNGVKKFVFASSGGVYGSKKLNSFVETSILPTSDKLGFYASSKLCGEILTNSYSSYFDVILLRFFFMYGAEQKKNMLIPRLVHNIKDKEKIILQGHEGIKINPIHVDDAKIAVQNTLSLNGSHVFNIAGEYIYTLRQLAEIIGLAMNKRPIFEITDSHPEDIIGNIELMKNKLYTPKIDFSEGIKEFIR